MSINKTVAATNAEILALHAMERRRWVTRFAVDMARFRRTNVVQLHESREAYMAYGHMAPRTAVIEWLARFHYAW